MRRSVLPFSLLVLFVACDDGQGDAAIADAGDARVRGALGDATLADRGVGRGDAALTADAAPRRRDAAPIADAGRPDGGLCVPGERVCLSPSVAGVCTPAGDRFETEACPIGGECFEGACPPPVCAPGATFCQDGERYTCSIDGGTLSPRPCDEGFVCIGQGECVDGQPNLILLVDTSTSMNQLVDGRGYARDCLGADCPSWLFPECEDAAAPQTRMGRVKQALAALFASDAARGLRLALQRFPQRVNAVPDCDAGYTWGRHTLQDHAGQREALDQPWFVDHLDQIIAVPFGPERALPREALARWVDFAEAVTPAGGACGDDADCSPGPCVDGVCQRVSDPELRGNGFTPLGVSLFYAGAYLRQTALVEGRACAADAECGSPHHTCVDGRCHDPLATCRPNVIVVFTDGGETDAREVDDFFHPRVQAKRLRYGLGCADDADCTGGATCEAGVCRPPAGAIDEAARVCAVFGTACVGDADCADPCGAGAQGCGNRCGPMRVDTVDEVADNQRVRDAAGNPIAITVHVVDASGVEGGNRDIAAYGGGVHVGVDLLDVDSLVRQVTPLFDTKRLLATCPALQPAGEEE